MSSLSNVSNVEFVRFVFLVAIAVLALSTVDGRIVVHTDNTMEHRVPIAVQQCRTTCVAKLNSGPHSQNSVLATLKLGRCNSVYSDCYMCWDYCEMLHLEEQRTFDLMCTDSVCFSGCELACKFYQQKTNEV